MTFKEFFLYIYHYVYYYGPYYAYYVLIGLLWGYFSRFSSTTNMSREGTGFFVFIGVVWPLVLVFSVACAICTAIDRGRRYLVSLVPIERMDLAVGKILKKKMHEDEYGTLYHMPSAYGRMTVVKVQDSTGTYWLPVDPGIQTAHQAVAWTYGLTADNYNPIRV